MKLKGIKENLQRMITANDGGISSKIVIGALGYAIMTLAIVLVMFINPTFPGLTEIVITHLLTSASLLGLTTVENIKNKRRRLLSDDAEQNCNSEENGNSEDICRD